MDEIRNEAIIEARKTVAVNLLKNGKLSIKEIAMALKLSVKEVEKLKNNLSSEIEEKTFHILDKK